MKIGAEKRVYFIKPVGMLGPIKIGCSSGPESRIEGLSLWSPWPLEIMVTIAGDNRLERQIHEHFAKHHSHKEWFNAHPDILVAVEKIRSGIPVGEAIDLSVKTGTIRTDAQLNRHPPENRRKTGYRMRLYWLERKRKNAGEDRRYAPFDVYKIMNDWRPDRCVLPSEADMQRLDQVLASPAEHFITQSERFPKPSVAA